jgi:hypothetical protein
VDQEPGGNKTTKEAEETPFQGILHGIVALIIFNHASRQGWVLLAMTGTIALHLGHRILRSSTGAGPPLFRLPMGRTASRCMSEVPKDGFRIFFLLRTPLDRMVVLLTTE